MCNIYNFDQTKLIRDGYTKCMIDCYRDPSVLQHVAISASDAWTNVKRGKLGAAPAIFSTGAISRPCGRCGKTAVGSARCEGRRANRKAGASRPAPPPPCFAWSPSPALTRRGGKAPPLPSPVQR